MRPEYIILAFEQAFPMAFPLQNLGPRGGGSCDFHLFHVVARARGQQAPWPARSWARNIQ